MASPKKNGQVVVHDSFSGKRIGGLEAFQVACAAGHDPERINTDEVVSPKRRRVTTEKSPASTRDIICGGF